MNKVFCSRAEQIVFVVNQPRGIQPLGSPSVRKKGLVIWCSPCGSLPKESEIPVELGITRTVFMADERHLKALRLLEQNPDMTQRELAEALGVSLGAANYCLKALVDKGWVKFENFQNNPNKLGYLYMLTPMGVFAKTQLTARFLRRKVSEYEALKTEIEELRAEIERAAV